MQLDAASPLAARAALFRVPLIDEDGEIIPRGEGHRVITGRAPLEMHAAWGSRFADSHGISAATTTATATTATTTNGESTFEVILVETTGSRGKQAHVVRFVHQSDNGGLDERSQSQHANNNEEEQEEDMDESLACAVLTECLVTYEDLPPTQLVEYCFAEKPEQWMLSNVSLPALEAYRAGKFEQWEKRLLAPTCAAELRRLVAQGPVSRVYDHLMFPSPDADQEQFVVDNGHGKTVNIPRPVHALRIWSVERSEYVPVKAELDGAPADIDAYWVTLVAKMRSHWGDEEYERMVFGAIDDTEN